MRRTKNELGRGHTSNVKEYIWGTIRVAGKEFKFNHLNVLERESVIHGRIEEARDDMDAIIRCYGMLPPDAPRKGLIFELCEGPDLLTHIIESFHFSERLAFQYISVIARGLSSLHDLGIVHGDLRPENIIFKNSQAHPGDLKLLDFGYGSWSGHEINYGGTSVYLAPEHIPTLGVEAAMKSPATDVWSLGTFYCVLYSRVCFLFQPLPTLSISTF